ncbi:MAG: hypothetical protein HRT44_09905 [Bdellovibrionales bacterium]|nr:hypothetical protein [Bdellovibrionales bacterium]NQZ19553.1 hypothetical protein [Bdellovibrionales bacterium]
MALTAPYMHSGSLSTLQEVVDHYNNVSGSLKNYALSKELSQFYGEELKFDKDPDRNELRFLQVEGTAFLLGLDLSDQEKADLVHFMKEGLTDLRFKQRMDSYIIPE